MPTKTLQLDTLESALREIGIQDAPRELIGKVLHVRFEWEKLEGGVKKSKVFEFYRQIRGATLTTSDIILDVCEMNFDPTGAVYFDFDEGSWIMPCPDDERPNRRRIKANLFEILPNPIMQ